MPTQLPDQRLCALPRHVGVDPSVPLADTDVKLDTAVLAYVRTLDLWGRSGKFDLILPYTWADGSAKLAGQARTRKVSGIKQVKGGQA